MAYVWELMERKGECGLVGRDLPPAARRSSPVVTQSVQVATVPQRAAAVEGVDFKQELSSFMAAWKQAQNAKARRNEASLSLKELMGVVRDPNVGSEVKKGAEELILKLFKNQLTAPSDD